MPASICFQNHPDCSLCTDHLRFIADRTVRDWRRIIAELGVNDHLIENVVEDADNRNYKSDSREVAYQGYLKWFQIDPKRAAFCVLSEVLDRLTRNDVTEELKERYLLSAPAKSLQAVKKVNSLPSAVNHFVGRECETEKIINFCDIECNLKLLLVIGLPGLGKSELLNNAINLVSEKYSELDIVWPLFPSNCGETKWGLEDVAVCIMEELQPGVCVSKHRVAVLHKMLTSIDKPTVLVLEIANLEFKQHAVLSLWMFVDRLLRFDNSNLKIIATSYKNPDVNQMQHLAVERIGLKELRRPSVSALLQSMNPTLGEDYCNKIYKYCGGNPFILRKLGAHIQNFTAPDEEMKEFLCALKGDCATDLQPFMRQTALKRDMGIVFQDLELDEQEALIKLCCFPNIIPIDVLMELFGKNVARIAKHLWHNHCILDRGRCGTSYRMNEITRTFIVDYAQSDSNLKSILRSAKDLHMQYHLNILLNLDEFYSSPNRFDAVELKNSSCRKLVEKYRQDCKLCNCYECVCVLPHILKIIFQKDKTIIMRSIMHGLDSEDNFYQTVDMCLKAVRFLRNVIQPLELQKLYDAIFEKLSQRNDKIRMAITMANLVFIKIYHKVRDEKDQNINYLTKSIDFLEMHKGKNILGVMETLALCYMNRGYLKGFYSYQFHSGEDDVKKARQLLSQLPEHGRLVTADLSTYGYMGAIYYRNNMLQRSMEERAIQIEGYKEHLGVHPYTAKSLHYQGQGYSKLGQFEKALNCCIVSYQMYYRLGEPLDMMRVLSTHGKVLIKRGHIPRGIRKLEEALVAGERVLGEHDKIAYCYEQLADAKEKSNDYSIEEIQALRNEADEMRRKFDRKISIVNRKTYSLQLSVDEYPNFTAGCADENDYYLQVALLMMLLAFLWHVYLIVFKSDCSVHKLF